MRSSRQLQGASLYWWKTSPPAQQVPSIATRKQRYWWWWCAVSHKPRGERWYSCVDPLCGLWLSLNILYITDDGCFLSFYTSPWQNSLLSNSISTLTIGFDFQLMSSFFHTTVDCVQLGGRGSNGLLMFLFKGDDLLGTRFDSFFRLVAVELLDFCSCDLCCEHGLSFDH